MKLKMSLIMVPVLFLSASVLDAGIVNTGTPNTTAPTGDYIDSGWQYVGTWGSGAATIVSPTQILTAAHFSATTFVYGGNSYATTSSLTMSGSDLRLVTLDTSTHGVFTSYASIYTGSTADQQTVVVGNGYQNGTELINHGWKPSTTKGLQWGTNTIEASYPTGLEASFASNPDLIGWDFDSIAEGSTPQEYGLTTWDSGGGVFVEEDGTWKLTGVNYAIVNYVQDKLGGNNYNRYWTNATFSESADGSNPFTSAGIYDATGLYFQNGESWILVPDGTDDQSKTWSFATDLTSSANSAWLETNLDMTVPEPATMTLLTLGGLALLRRRRK